ncbi:MAG TPA: energy transducer TonB [Vicinamibacterales bacterium]|jgi:TonB family protein
MLHFDDLGPRTPQLPRRRFGALTQLATSAALHASAAIIAVSIATISGPSVDVRRAKGITDQSSIDVRHIVFLSPAMPQPGGGGGGGGNQQAGPIRRAQGVGSDQITLRVRKPAPVVAPSTPVASAQDVSPLPALVLDAKPLASGTFDQIGLPSGGVPAGTSTGPGSGGGVGSGNGTGIGSGNGPGLGPGSDGGSGGGPYRVGGAVSPPRVITQVKPAYTNEALVRRIQGTVVVELIVTGEGLPSHIRVVRSLDPGGLDDQAITAVSQWRFEPGRLGRTPVDVLVTIVLDFTIR